MRTLTFLGGVSKGALAFIAAVGLAACGGSSDDEGGNVIPSTTADTTADTTDGETGTTGGTQTGVPATYRFTCIDIQQAGSAGDGDIQTNLLQQQWGSDINNYRLNILVDFLTLDEDAGTGTMQIRSGIGTGNGDQCSEPNSDSSVHAATFSANESKFIENTATDTCAMAAVGTEPARGSFTLNTQPADVVYIYAEDDSGNAFNCTSDTTPDSVPIHAIQAQFTLSEDEQVAYGELTGCLVESEAEALCSCLGTCVPPSEPYAQCGCNPDATPLRELLLGVTSTDNCTTLMGETAFDVKIAFTAERLPNLPEACG